MKSNLLTFLVCFAALFASHAQQREVTGTVASGSNLVQGVAVLNIYAEKETKTDSVGAFTIMAKAGDTLVFTAPGIVTKKIIIQKSSFNAPLLVEVLLNDKYQLDEILIEKDTKLTAKSLGIAPKGVAVYTDVERKAQTGARIGPRGDQSIGGGLVINGDAIINIFTGKRKALKKAVEIERTEKRIEILAATYDEDKLLEVYGIPREYAKGFLHYAVADKVLATAIDENNAAVTESQLTQLAVQYLELQLNDK